MLRIAKNLVKTFEQSVHDISGDRSLDVYFQSIPPNLLIPGNDTNTSIHGLRVVKSEESQLQLQSFFDSIVGINNQPIPTITNQHGFLYPDYNSIFRILNNSCGNSVQFNVWSAKGGFYRDEYIHITPKTAVEDVPLNNDGEDSTHVIFESLGFAVQWTPLIASTYTYHVLNINLAEGPAQLAGLVPGEDYIIGCQDGLLATGGETILQDIVRSRTNQDLVLYVYNLEVDCVRPVTVHIGSDGRLGCGVGYGFIHRIPPPKSNYNFEVGQNSEAFIPARALQSQPIATTNAPPQQHTARKKKRQPNAPNTSIMQDYFNEGKDESPRRASPSTPIEPPRQHKPQE
ncbi:HCL655Cp [Eremothecium sinecaudum]|uniref:HCL655Cp n=1 Tax=Eremothecium sinecaudum TaxID=45286 RepID=A0A109UXS1_9SACH|nr:HCL655Cp [Eremothecium sinecaudum]AMD19496.1 HCL655Cp [Eremothecium sinecaudum]